MPWAQRPAELPLNVEECRTALWRNRGNVTKAADLLKTTPERLRRFIRASPYLSAQQEEAQEQLLDVAEDNLYEALVDNSDTVRRDMATKFVLKELGGKRGYGTGKSGITIQPGQGGGRMVIEWGDGTSFDNNNDKGGQTIEHDSKVING